MLKFASALEAGPYYHNCYCYDILVLKDHCEFSMERCGEIDLKIAMITLLTAPNTKNMYFWISDSLK